MSAREDHPFVLVGDGYAAYLAMCDRIDALEAEVDRLENEIDELDFQINEHRAHMTCTPERREP